MTSLGTQYWSGLTETEIMMMMSTAIPSFEQSQGVFVSITVPQTMKRRLGWIFCLVTAASAAADSAANGKNYPTRGRNPKYLV